MRDEEIEFYERAIKQPASTWEALRSIIGELGVSQFVINHNWLSDSKRIAVIYMYKYGLMTSSRGAIMSVCRLHFKLMQ